ncbi:UDP-galactopyranose mutase [Hathewaya proteolytica DSM 3090]|uniref:UDP-galactopyranose mutase n=1 Tax=Hathewaya proteolytica DSM 3090 TaxID=1121331 RepID=A0A1M6PTC6_9CLOT|nr:UDP-galactopyranose mutase [Hathewaya proteolytica]SHK11165.1 UDP-galactopyranose mutase [Hathewaya proteolytica DSM 3090]
MKKYDYLVVGAGLFGAVFAHEAAKYGKSCIVIDKRDHVGGNVYCEEFQGIQVHKYGAHIFHTDDEEIWNYVNKIVKFNNFINSPIANYKGEIYNLPFNMNTFNKLWGVVTPEEAKERIESQKKAYNCVDICNLEQQAISLVGTDIYEKLIKGYTEKQWGRPCSKLPSFIIKRIPVRYTYDNNYFNDKYQGIPEGGYTKLIQGLLKDADVFLNTDFLKEKNLYENVADKIIYTGMIDEYYGYRFGHLQYRSLKLEEEVISKENYQGNAVVNYTSSDVPYTRIIEHRHFQKECHSSCTVITREYPLEWTPGEEPYYPVLDDRNKEVYEKYRALAMGDKHILFGGRLGEYKYYDMHKVIKEALKMAKGELIGDGYKNLGSYT